MEPVRGGCYFPSYTSSDEDEDSVTSRFESLSMAVDDEGLFSLQEYLQSEVRPVVPNDNNAIAAVSESALRASLERKGIELYGQILKNPATAYERTIAFLRENPAAVTIKTEGTNNSPLHEVVIEALDNQFHKLVPLTALLEMGADREALNLSGQMPIDIALAADNVLVVQLLTSENPSKELLLEVALTNQLEELVTWLV